MLRVFPFFKIPKANGSAFRIRNGVHFLADPDFPESSTPFFWMLLSQPGFPCCETHTNSKECGGILLIVRKPVVRLLQFGYNPCRGSPSDWIVHPPRCNPILQEDPHFIQLFSFVLTPCCVLCYSTPVEQDGVGNFLARGLRWVVGVVALP